MTKDEVFSHVKNAIMDVLPEVVEGTITFDKSLVELGANSIDRGEIILQSMMNLGVKVPLTEVGTITKIDDLVNFYCIKLETK